MKYLGWVLAAMMLMPAYLSLKVLFWILFS